MLPGWDLITWIVFWLPGGFVGSLSCSWQESRCCLRARAKALLLPQSFENGEEQFAFAGCNPYPNFLHSITTPLLLWLNISFEPTSQNWFFGFATMTFQKLPELTLAQASQSLLRHLARGLSGAGVNYPARDVIQVTWHGIPLSPGMRQPVSSQGLALRVPVSVVSVWQTSLCNFLIMDRKQIYRHISEQVHK